MDFDTTMTSAQRQTAFNNEHHIQHKKAVDAMMEYTDFLFKSIDAVNSDVRAQYYIAVEAMKCLTHPRQN